MKDSSRPCWCYRQQVILDEITHWASHSLLSVMVTTEHPQLITVTVYKWKHLLMPDQYKDLIIDSLRFLVRENRVMVDAFVMLSHHMHLIWQEIDPHKRANVQRDFLKYMGQQIKFDLTRNHPKVLEHFEVVLKDRKYQFWKRNALAIDLYSPIVFDQKLDYIHQNPVKVGLCKYPEEYHYSSAGFYLTNDQRFDFLSHHSGN